MIGGESCVGVWVVCGVLCKLAVGDYKMGVFETGCYELKRAVILCKPDAGVVRRVHAAMLCELARHGKLINAS